MFTYEVTLLCDKCEVIGPSMGSTENVHSAEDEAERKAASQGWIIKAGTALCPECVKDENEAK